MKYCVLQCAVLIVDHIDCPAVKATWGRTECEKFNKIIK